MSKKQTKKTSEKSNRNIQKDLIKIYKVGTDKMPDMSKLERKEKNIKKKVLIFLIVVLVISAAATWAGLFYFNQPTKTEEKRVKLEISGPQILSSGDRMTYTISYTNLEKVDLENIQLNVRYPKNFVFLESNKTPNDERNRSWLLDDLKRGQTSEVKIIGRLIGEENSEQILSATLSFIPSNFSSEFQESSSFSTKIESSILALDIEGSKQVSLDEQVNYKIKYKNKSTEDLENIQILAIYPEVFEIESTEPESTSEDKDTWLIEKLGSGEEKEIEIKGKYPLEDDKPSAIEDADQELKIQIGFKNDQNFQAEQEKVFITEIVEKNIIVNLLINESPTDQTVNFGDTLDYSITYQNKTSVDMEDIEIEAILATTSINEKTILDWRTIEDKNDGGIEGQQLDPNNRAGIITWNKRRISKLSSLEPDEGGTIDFKIKILDFEDLPDNDLTDFVIKNTVRIKVGNLSNMDKTYEARSNQITLSINTDVQLDAYGRYYNDNEIPIGSGPIPPQVGKTTNYKIYWNLSNSLHEATDVKVSTSLPKEIIWDNDFDISTGTLKYDEENNNVSWDINKLPAGISDMSAVFEVHVTPTDEQTDKILDLTGPIQFGAIDKESGDAITKTLPKITTNMDGDPLAEGKGIVIGN